MTPGLNECLRAAGLQHCYARFTSMGVHHATHLSALTIEDYPILGIHTMEDRTRLFHLVQMVKSLDLEALRYEDGDDYDADGGDEGYPIVDGSFTYDGYGYPDEDVYDGEDERRGTINELNAATFTRSSRVCRRLDFSCENIDQQQKLLCYQVGSAHGCTSHVRDNRVQNKGSAAPPQNELGSGSAVLCKYKQNHNYRKDGHNRPSNHHTAGNTRSDIRGGTAMYNSDTQLSPKFTSFNKQEPRPANMASKRFDSKPGGYKDRNRISKREIGHNWEMGHIAKPTPVYESKRTAGYNYGVPQSFPPASNKKQEGKQQISVCVRKRPLTRAERRREADVVTTSGEECVIVHESKEAVDLTQYILQHRFYFDKVFGEESSNEEVYQQTAYPLVQHMLNGGKATCFAYGQTGAGKTHTMLGPSPGRPGLYALAVRDIFAHLSTTHIYSPLLVYVSFFEIYCGQLYDLLDHRKRLFAREDGQKVVHIAGLRYVQVDSVNSLLEVISQGTEERTQGMSGVNPLSSRSHALLQIQLRCPNQQIAGRMWFVDLAGSERASDTREPDRQSRMEAAEINQSLLALKECIRSLDQEQSHTPFRQSKLTQVLKDSFVGDSMTCMIANISPGHFATEHTLNTLRYADRVKELRGQGGLRGGRRSKTIPSPKHNLSNNSSGSTRGKSPPKKQKLGRQREAFTRATPTTKLATADAVLCSTPKSSRWKAEPSTRHKKGIGLEHITPIRGWLRMGDKSHGQEEAGERKDRRRESETHGRPNSHSVGDQNTADTELWGAQESFTQKESGNYQREKGNQHLAVKIERQEERRWRNQLRQMESSRDTCSEVERLRGSDFKKADESNKEKQRHLRQYHLQLQQFIPLTASSSVSPVSPSTCPSLSSSRQASLSSYISPLSSSSLRHPSHSSASALIYHSLEEVLDTYRAGVVEVKAEHNKGQLSFHLPTETSPSCNNNNEDTCGDCGGVGEDFGVSWEGKEIKFGQRGESDRRGSVVTPGETLVRKEERRPAVMEGGERRWAWVPTTETEQTDMMTGATPTNVVAQVSHNCHSENRGHVGEEGVDSSDVSADGVWSTEEERRAESYGVVSIPGNNDRNSLFNHPPFESPLRRAPAERPLSPACEHVNVPPMSNIQSNSDHTHCSKANRSDLPQDETFPSHIMSPLSMSLLQVDRHVATASFLIGEQNTTSLYERGEGIRREVEKENHRCSGIAEKVVEDEDIELRLSLLELPQPKTNCPPTFEAVPAVHHTEQGKGRMKPPTHGVKQVSLQHQDNSQKHQTIPVLGKMKSISPLVHCSGVTNSSSSIPNGAAQIPTKYAYKTHNKPAKTSASVAQSEDVVGQHHTAHSNNPNTSLQPKSPAESSSQESKSNHQIPPIIHLSALEDLDYAQWHVAQAHWEQLEEMEDLRHREGTLLCQQPEMAFGEYVHKLEEIMERKAWCIQSMRAQLEPYLKPAHINRSHNQSEYNNN